MSNTKFNILVVDDEQDIVDLLEYRLSREGFTVYTAYNGLQAIIKAEELKPDVIILDINMPKMDGIQAGKKIKKNITTADTSIIYLTAKSDETTELLALEIGADDFIAKPIKLDVLIARINNVLKKKTLDNNTTTDLDFGSLIIKPNNYTILLDNVKVDMAKKEFELLYLLAKKPDAVITRKFILDAIWGNEVIVGDRTIDVHIRKIRQKLNDKFIYTVKGVGYKFIAE